MNNEMEEGNRMEQLLEQLKEIDPLKYNFWNYLKVEDVAGDFDGSYQKAFKSYLFDNASEALIEKTLASGKKNLADCFGYVLEAMKNKYIEKFGKVNGGFSPNPKDVYQEVMHYFEEDSIEAGAKPAAVTKKEPYKTGSGGKIVTVDPAKDIEKIKKQAIAEYKAELKAAEEKKKQEALAKKETEKKAKEEANKQVEDSTSLGGMFDLVF